MRRRLLLHVCMLVTLLAWSSNAAAKATSWAQAELRAVVAAGLMAKETAARPDDPLTRGELETISAGLLHVVPTTPSAPTVTVTMSGLDANLVSTLGLTETAKLFTQGAKTAGLNPPSRFGNEAVARLLGLRTNHPASLDSIELSPNEPASHAEAAYSAARILKFGEFDVASRAAGARRLRLLRVRLARLQAAGVSERGQARRRAQGPDDVCHERRGAGREADRAGQAPARRRDLLRRRRAEVEAGAGGPHGPLPGQRVVHPLIRLRRRGRTAERLVRQAVRLGPPAAGRSGPRFRVVSPNPHNPPLGGFLEHGHPGQSPRLAVNGGIHRMLQWKPKLIALIAVLVLIAALLGQFTWEAATQFTW